MEAKPFFQANFPTLNQKEASHPTEGEMGGFYSLEYIKLVEPVRAMVYNQQTAQRRAQGTIPYDGMTQDIYSYWSDLK